MTQLILLYGPLALLWLQFHSYAHLGAKKNWIKSWKNPFLCWNKILNCLQIIYFCISRLRFHKVAFSFFFLSLSFLLFQFFLYRLLNLEDLKLMASYWLIFRRVPPSLYYRQCYPNILHFVEFCIGQCIHPVCTNTLTIIK